MARAASEVWKYGDPDSHDLLAMLLAAQDEDGARMTDAQVLDEVLTLFLAGHETTALSLSWTVSLLCEHPEVTRRLREWTETPIVVLGHMPLWPLYAPWGWGTEDSGEAMTYLKRFGSVTVLNGHIHQIQQKVEGTVTFYTARSTAYPQPAPGDGPGPGPLKDLGTRQLQSYLGIRDVRHVQGQDAVSVAEEMLS